MARPHADWALGEATGRDDAKARRTAVGLVDRRGRSTVTGVRGPWGRPRRVSGWRWAAPRPRPPLPPTGPGRRRLVRRLRHAAVWLALGVLLALGYSYRFELGDVVDRLGGELIPYAAVTTEDGALRVRAQPDGHFFVDARVDGQEVRFLVDTGASVVALSPADANRIGLDRARLNFSRRLQTAGGIVRAAPVRIRMLELGDIRLTNVRAVVNEEFMPHSLLGVSALDRLGGYEVRDGTLTLKP